MSQAVEASTWALRDSAAACGDLGGTLGSLANELAATVDDLRSAIEGEVGLAIAELIGVLSPYLESGRVAFTRTEESLESLSWQLDGLVRSSELAERRARRLESELDAFDEFFSSELNDIDRELRLANSQAATARGHAAGEIEAAAALAVKAAREAYEHSLVGRFFGVMSGTWEFFSDGVTAVFTFSGDVLLGAWDAVYGLGRLVFWDLTFSVVADPGKWLKNWEGLAYGAYRMAEAATILGMVFTTTGLAFTNPEIRERWDSTVETLTVVISLDTLREKGFGRWIGTLGGELLLGKGLGKLGGVLRGSSKLDDLGAVSKLDDLEASSKLDDLADVSRLDDVGEFGTVKFSLKGPSTRNMTNTSESVSFPERTYDVQPGRQIHVLDGEIKSNGSVAGGHHHSGSGQFRFPNSWSKSDVFRNAERLLLDTRATWERQTGKAGSLFTRGGDPARFIVRGTVDGQEMRVVLEPMGDGIVSIFPKGR